MEMELCFGKWMFRWVWQAWAACNCHMQNVILANVICLEAVVGAPETSHIKQTEVKLAC